MDKPIRKAVRCYLIKDNKVTIYPSKIKNNNIICEDLRGGAAMVIAGLVAHGITEVEEIHYILRGYEKFEQKLSSLGAKIYMK